MNNPSIYIICGKCGCSTMFEYSIKNEMCDIKNKEIQEVLLICNNCSTINYLKDTANNKNENA